MKLPSWAPSLLLGQLLSVCLAGTGVFSQLLSEDGASMPTGQTFLLYVSLCLVYLPIHLRRRSVQRRAADADADAHAYADADGVAVHNEGNIQAPEGRRGKLSWLRVHWAVYVLVALVDVEGNYFVVKAYQYTDIISVQLLDCSSIAFVMVLSFLILRSRYRWLHLAGVVLCIGGIVTLVVSDMEEPRNGSNPLLGDLLCVVGAACYACSNVLQEKLVKEHDKVEFLGMLGLFGSVINGLQWVVLERDEIHTMTWTPIHVLWLLGYVLFMFALYSMVPLLLCMSNAALMNLSFLTSDVWAILAGVFIFDSSIMWLLGLALALEVAGIVLFNWQDLRQQQEQAKYDPVLQEQLLETVELEGAGSSETTGKEAQEREPLLPP